MITYVDYRRLSTGATDCATLDDFIAECGGSVPAGYVEDGDPAKALELLGRIWALRAGSFRDVLALSGLSQAAFSREYVVPLRTIEHWLAAGSPDQRRTYVIDLLATDVINSLELAAEG